jgi:enhancing lycopene biosynthesis protein 2
MKLCEYNISEDVNEVQVDVAHKILTTPAFMKGTAEYIQVHEGIGKMIDELFKLC